MQVIYTDDEIKGAYETDAKIIDYSFKISNQLGRESVTVAVNGFTALLVSQKGNFVPGMDLDYRRYIVGLLVILMETITDETHKAIIFSQIIMPGTAE